MQLARTAGHSLANGPLGCPPIMTRLYNSRGLGPHHLNGTDVLGLLHVDVGQVEPDVWQLSCCLTHLSEHITSFTIVALVGQHRSWR